MKPIRDVLRLLAEPNCSIRKVATLCRISRQAVADYKFRAEQAGLTWPLPEELDDFALEATLFPVAARDRNFRCPRPDWDAVHAEMITRKGATLQVLHEEYCRQHVSAMSYTRFCQLYRIYKKAASNYLRRDYAPGSIAMVDFAGLTVTIHGFGGEGEIRAQIFVGMLCASGLIYVEAARSQTIPDWLACHTRMYETWGGTPETIICDNLKSAVTKVRRHDPEIHPAYSDHARHYSVLIAPARPYKPRDKGKVERAVQIVERYILFRIRKVVFTSLNDLNNTLRECTRQLNDRTVRYTNKSRMEFFNQIERSALRPLPSQPYVHAEHHKVRVGADYHFHFSDNYYSVPYRFARQQVEIRATTNIIEIYCGGRRVASHPRIYGPGTATDPQHRDPRQPPISNGTRKGLGSGGPRWSRLPGISPPVV